MKKNVFATKLLNGGGEWGI